MNDSPFSRGGMCANPFGGEDRIDRINLLEYLEPNAPAEKVLYSCIIQDAASNYLYAFLGKNGTSTEEFFSAWQYFFRISSTNNKSWNKPQNKTIKLSYVYRGNKVIENRPLTDDEIKLMCFDKHYDLSGLSEHMHIDKFRAKLQAKRRKILIDNWEQVQTYIKALYQHELKEIADGQQVPLQIWDGDLLSILIDPPTPMHLASVIYVPNRLKRSRRQRAKDKAKEGAYAELAKKLQSNRQQQTPADWGPLSQLGANDVKIAGYNSSNSICVPTDRDGDALLSSNCG